MLKFWVLVAALTAVLSMSAAKADERYAELKTAKLNLLGTLRADPDMGLRSDQTNAELMVMIEGTCTNVGYADMTTASKFSECCQKFSYKLKKLSEYTFETVLLPEPQVQKHRFRKGVHHQNASCATCVATF